MLDTWETILTQLQNVASHASDWSATANSLKSRLDFIRNVVFVLTMLGALTSSLASQIPQGVLRTWIVMVAALCLGFATFGTARFLGGANQRNWVRARAIAESLNRAAFTRAAGAAPYNDPATADQLLFEELKEIEAAATDLSPDRAVKHGSAPTSTMSAENYVANRVQHQIEKYYEPKARGYRELADRLRWVEIGLAATATATTIVATIIGKIVALGIWEFDLAALTAVLTTLGGAVLSHVEAQRYEFLATSYSAAARRLRDQLTQLGAKSGDAWSGFVKACEDIIAAENASWIAKWTKV